MAANRMRIRFQDINDPEMSWYENINKEGPFPSSGDFILGPKEDEDQRDNYQILYREWLFVSDGSYNDEHGIYNPIMTFYAHKSTPAHKIR